MDRRTFVSLLSSGVAAIGSSSASSLAATEATQKSKSLKAPKHDRAPNIILMICDDLGYGDLGCYGSKLPTPHLDAMAAAGALFTHWNTPHPICSASRAALLTGRYGVRMNTNGAFGPGSAAGTSLDETLVSNLLHEKGYTNKAIGKWHLGDKPEYLPTHRGFDSFLGVPWSDDFNPLPLYRDTQLLEQDTDRDILTPRYTEEAVKFLKDPDRKTQPFFLYVAYSYPHDPAQASPRFKDKTGFGNVGDSIAEIDWSVGEIMRAVDEQGLAEDTLLLFTSDHGPWYQGSPGALRGRKGSTFEGGVRVPMLARWTGRIEPGRRVETWCSHLDMLPSLAAVCGLSLPEKPLDGADMSSVWFDHPRPVERKPVIYFSPLGDRALDVHCVRRDQWKVRVAQAVQGEMYVNDRTTAARGSAWLIRPELYNLEQDPEESYNIANLHPDITAELIKSLEDQMPSFPAHVVSAYSALKQHKGDITTPPGASPRPYMEPNPSWSWEPEDRRWSSVSKEAR